MAKIVTKERYNHPGYYKYLVMDEAERVKYMEMKDGEIRIRPEASALSKETINYFKKELEKLAEK